MTSIAIIGTMGLPARYGGFETLAENLVKQLASDHPITVYCSGRAYKTRRPDFLGAKLVYIPFKSNGAQSVPYDVFSILHAHRHADVLLLLGVSGCAFLPLIKLFSKKKFIVHLDGIDWRRPKWGWAARHFLRFSEWMAAKYADCVIADNAGIQDYIFKNYKQDSFLIEYGGDHADYILDKKNSGIQGYEPSGKSISHIRVDGAKTDFENYAFSVCRIEPENNIHIILRAFSINGTLPLVLVGNWSASEYGRALRNEYGDTENILLLDSIYDPVRLFALRSKATLYVHGHSAGGTNPSLVEAMYLGLPILAFNVIFNKATTDDKAIYFEDQDSLVKALKELDIDRLSELARKMKSLGHFRYTWNIVANKYSYLFKALGGDEIEKLGISAVIANMPESTSMAHAASIDVAEGQGYLSKRQDKQAVSASKP